ncbi:uncharacterized protein LOC117167900 isoform X2 [Belonocnema kinseyi]|uniref:uncharacterized protein LOC117167900 isoform X2 n=1 Tax=Belonocnema kinseyi TaxID=2817044 RepID=UPI00143D341A|nr:uncharacterized protein LOC117167900 isoform X2 [Belonocnema kinseyi]
MKIFFPTILIAFAVFSNFVVSPMQMYKSRPEGESSRKGKESSGTEEIVIPSGKTSEAVLFYYKDGKYHEILTAKNENLKKVKGWYVGKKINWQSTYPLYNKEHEHVFQWAEEPFKETQQHKASPQELVMHSVYQRE